MLTTFDLRSRNLPAQPEGWFYGHRSTRAAKRLRHDVFVRLRRGGERDLAGRSRVSVGRLS